MSKLNISNTGTTVRSELSTEGVPLYKKKTKSNQIKNLAHSTTNKLGLTKTHYPGCFGEKGCSTQHLLIDVIEEWKTAFDRGIAAKPLHNRDIASIHFNHFHCMGICDKLSRHLSMLPYIYLNVDEC